MKTMGKERVIQRHTKSGGVVRGVGERCVNASGQGKKILPQGDKEKLREVEWRE